jgi:hypothetical protein
LNPTQALERGGGHQHGAHREVVSGEQMPHDQAAFGDEQAPLLEQHRVRHVPVVGNPGVVQRGDDLNIHDARRAWAFPRSGPEKRHPQYHACVRPAARADAASRQ